MAEVRFYHLLHTPLERALMGLLPKALGQHPRILLVSPLEQRLEMLDQALWTVKEDSFLPHGRAGGTIPAAVQPVLLSERPEPENGASMVILLDGAEAAPERFQLTCELFDGRDEEAVARARALWVRHRDAGHRLSYIQQQPGGGWAEKASANTD